MNNTGKFYGIGVGPGPARFIPLAAWDVLQKVQLIFTPRARHVSQSIARQCLKGLDIPNDRFREVIYNMDPDRVQVRDHYLKLADEIATELRAGKDVAYLTIGDSLTYSTYSYTLEALLKTVPNLEYCTLPGITSYAAAAAVLSFPLGQGKDRMLILPCPDDPEQLRHEIETHDIVVLMKIGARLPAVLDLLNDMGIANYCGFASRLGLSGEVISSNITALQRDNSLGYLTTMLIRKTAQGVQSS